MHPIEEKMRSRLEDRRQGGSLRNLFLPEGRVDFCSNDYLGLARCPRLRQQVLDATRDKSIGATGSRLISGNSALAERLEAQLAAFHRAGSGLLFSSGYMANAGLLPAVAGRNETVLFDDLAHASIRDGLTLSRAQTHSFRHNDLDDLKHKLAGIPGYRWVNPGN